MDENVFSEEDRKKIYDELADLMIDGMEKGLLSGPESKISAQFILDNLEMIKTHEEFKKFLSDLSKKWTVYLPAYTKIKESISKQEDDKKLKEITDKLNQFVKN